MNSKMFKTSSNWDGWNINPSYQDRAYEKTYAPGCKVEVICNSIHVSVFVNGTFYCGCRDEYFARQIAEMYMYTHGGIEDND